MDIELKNKLFSQLIESAIDGKVITDIKGVITYVNPAMEKIYRYEKGELIGKPVGILNPNRNSLPQIMSSVKKAGSWYGESLQQRKNKERFPALLSLSAVKDDKGDMTAILGVVRDLTEYKKIQDGLARSYRIVEIGQLAAGVAHEFNNLLNIIGGTAQYAKGVKDEKEMQEALDIITKSSDRGAGVVKSLLAFARRTELKKESIDIAGALEEVLRLVSKDLENSGIRVIRKYSDVPRILADIGQLEQVLLNIIINARYAMPKGGRLSICLAREEGFIKIQFHNTGKVIAREDLPRIFTPFFSSRAKKRTGIMGTGLGLSISRDIIVSHGGTIKAESEKGKGTTFTISLPIIEGMFKELEKGIAAAKPDEKREAGLKTASILVVDDENYICGLFKKVLEKNGCSVTIANSGRNAVNICKEKKFDIIYMDVVMPRMDGIAASKKILKTTPDARIIFMSGKPIEDKAVSMSMDRGEIDFLRKPIPVDELIRRTQDVLLKKNG